MNRTLSRDREASLAYETDEEIGGRMHDHKEGLRAFIRRARRLSFIDKGLPQVRDE